MAEQFNGIIVLMAVAVLCVWSFRRLSLPPILAYIVAGILAGPHILSIGDPAAMDFLAELGIVFLLFTLGLEFSLPRMFAMRTLVFGIGLSQTVLTTVLVMGLAMLLGINWQTAFVIGAMVAMSSTAIVIKQAAEMGFLHNRHGQISVSILLFQDIAVVPLLIIIPLLSGGDGQNLWSLIGLSVLKGVTVLVVLMYLGKHLLPRIFAAVASTRTDELFVLTTILITLMAAAMTHFFGLSMALGAFLAGMMLGESQYRHQLEADIRPFRDILLGLFFVTVGMRLDIYFLIEQLHWVLLCVGSLMVVKAVVIFISARLFNVSYKQSLATALKLCQMGEFGFVIAALATHHLLLTEQQASLLVSVGVLSMVLSPYLIHKSYPVAKHFFPSKKPKVGRDPDDSPELAEHVVILGYGRVGQSISRLLRTEDISYIALDADPIRVHESRSAGEPVYYGHAKQKDILRSIGIERAKLVVISFDSPQQAMTIMSTLNDLNPKLPVVVRARDDKHLDDLLAAGATQVVPELLEGSLMLVSQVMHLSGIPMSRILKCIRTERKNHYGHLHGFFPGESTDLTYQKQEHLEFMHAITMTANADAIGKTLDEVDFSQSRVELKELRRANELLCISDELMLKQDDIVVISGKPRYVERFERILLEGRG